jgi:hypothetical protein
MQMRKNGRAHVGPTWIREESSSSWIPHRGSEMPLSPPPSCLLLCWLPHPWSPSSVLVVLLLFLAHIIDPVLLLHTLSVPPPLSVELVPTASISSLVPFPCRWSSTSTPRQLDPAAGPAQPHCQSSILLIPLSNRHTSPWGSSSADAGWRESTPIYMCCSSPSLPICIRMRALGMLQ